MLDILATKKSAIDLAVDATNTILSIDQIIMAKELEAQLCHNSQDRATGIKTTERVPFINFIIFNESFTPLVSTPPLTS